MLPESVTVSTTVLGSATSVPFKLVRRASVFFVEYSTFRAFLILSRSAFVNWLGLDTRTLFVLVSSFGWYLYVWDLTTILK